MQRTLDKIVGLFFYLSFIYIFIIHYLFIHYLLFIIIAKDVAYRYQATVLG